MQHLRYTFYKIPRIDPTDTHTHALLAPNRNPIPSGRSLFPLESVKLNTELVLAHVGIGH